MKIILNRLHCSKKEIFFFNSNPIWSKDSCSIPGSRGVDRRKHYFDLLYPVCQRWLTPLQPPLTSARWLCSLGMAEDWCLVAKLSVLLSVWPPFSIGWLLPPSTLPFPKVNLKNHWWKNKETQEKNFNYQPWLIRHNPRDYRRHQSTHLSMTHYTDSNNLPVVDRQRQTHLHKTMCSKLVALQSQNNSCGHWWGRQARDRSALENLRDFCTLRPIWNVIYTVQIFYLGMSKYLGSGWLYQKTKGTLWSQTSRDLSDSTVGSPLHKQYQKKVTETKVEKSQTAPWKWHFSPHDFLGLQQSLLNINCSLGIFLSKYQGKNLLKSTTVIAESVKQVDFDGFRTVNVIFGWNQLHQKNFTFFGNEISEKFCNYISFDGFDTPKKHFRLVSDFFFSLNFI